MKVEELMTRRVASCSASDTLNAAARIMWEHDCGCAPVVADGRVVGMITDRDICMAAYTQDRPLSALPVSQAMSREVHSCRPDDPLAVAERTMRERQIRRLPVIDASGHLVGILSLNDVARAFAREGERAAGGARANEVASTLAAVCRPRHAKHAATAA
ncbi:MAG TPA: CBS domain-containing protein [Candidatus Binatia bacterium]|nr:CBS domain-containing protein [Candidatus Binatia bacterium]